MRANCHTNSISLALEFRESKVGGSFISLFSAQTTGRGRRLWVRRGQVGRSSRIYEEETTGGGYSEILLYL
jgi:hypothetical protein